MKYIAILLLAASIAHAQQASVSVYCPEMLVLKQRVGLWQCQLEPTDVTIKWAGGLFRPAKTVKVSVPRKARTTTGDVDIPATYVRGVFRRAVDPCVGSGKLHDGSMFTMKLPREPVEMRGFERTRFLKWEPVIVAVAIDAAVTLEKEGGLSWAGTIRFPDCRTRQLSPGVRLADEVTARGTIRALPMP